MSGKGSRRKGADFERLVRGWFHDLDENHPLWLVTWGHLGTEEEDMVVQVGDQFLSIECKNHKTVKLPAWWAQTQVQAYNRSDKAHPVLIHKRTGSTQPHEQWVTMSLGAFTELMRRVVK